MLHWFNKVVQPQSFEKVEEESVDFSYQPLHEEQSSRSRQYCFLATVIEKGQCTYATLSTSGLLRHVEQHYFMAHPNNEPSGFLKLRDLRQLCSESVGSEGASIEVRRNCILVHFVFLRAIILYRKIILLGPTQKSLSPSYLFPSEGFLLRQFNKKQSYRTKENKTLIKKLVKVSSDQTSSLFEVTVLELLLLEACDALRRDLLNHMRASERIVCRSIESLASSDGLHTVYELQRQIGTVNDRTRSLSDALQQILNNEQDLLRLQLSLFWNKTLEWDHPVPNDFSEDIEMFLESYHQQLVSMLRYGTRIDEALDDTLQLIHLNLASIRNNFLKCELALEIVGTVVACIAALTSLLGMNIPNGFEKETTIFWPIVYSALTTCLVTGVLTMYFFRRIRL